MFSSLTRTKYVTLNLRIDCLSANTKRMEEKERRMKDDEGKSQDRYSRLKMEIGSQTLFLSIKNCFCVDDVTWKMFNIT